MFSTVITVCFWLSNDMLSLFSRKLAELHHGLQSAANKVVVVAVLQLTPHAPTCLVIACRGHRYNQLPLQLHRGCYPWPWLALHAGLQLHCGCPGSATYSRGVTDGAFLDCSCRPDPGSWFNVALSGGLDERGGFVLQPCLMLPGRLRLRACECV